MLGCRDDDDDSGEDEEEACCTRYQSFGGDGKSEGLIEQE